MHVSIHYWMKWRRITRRHHVTLPASFAHCDLVTTRILSLYQVKICRMGNEFSGLLQTLQCVDIKSMLWKFIFESSISNALKWFSFNCLGLYRCKSNLIHFIIILRNTHNVCICVCVWTVSFSYVIQPLGLCRCKVFQLDIAALGMG